MSGSIIFRVAIVVFAFVLAITTLFHRNTPFRSHASIDEIERPIYNTTLGFERIFVLNLPSRTDHADAMKLSAAVTDLHFEFIDGVNGQHVLDKVLPAGAGRSLGNGNIGSWRAHMNAMARIVSENITSALIMEDDVDWDVRIKQQMREFSRGTRSLTQPLLGSIHRYADPSYKERRPTGVQQKHPMGDDDMHYDLLASAAPQVQAPIISPYGDDWDVLWPGSCAMNFPRSRDQVPHGRYIIPDDETVIGPNDLRMADPHVLPGSYPPHTRIVHHVWDPICTFAYAVSQRGARKILYEYGIKHLDRAFDQMMCDFCDANTCMAVSPQLFSSHRPAGPIDRDSDINGFGQDKSQAVREKGSTENIQRSVRLNLEAILNGAPISDLDDQFPSS